MRTRRRIAVKRPSVTSSRKSVGPWRRVGIAGVAMLAVLGLAVPTATSAQAAPAKQAAKSAAPHAGPGLPPHQRPVNPPVVGAPKPGKQTTPKAAPVTEPAAQAQARATGKPVVVTSKTTDNSEVEANPDGTFTMHSTLTATRTQVNGQWVAIDPTLHTNADGTLSPNATTLGLTFSGGGTAPMVTMTQGSDRLALSWPAPLPNPQVSGSTATYPEVLPGVDLRLTAAASDYQEILVVHDAAAAANPALTAIHLSATATGLTLHSDANNLLTATDIATGAQVFHGSTPVMWDSTTDPARGTTPSAGDPGTGHVSQLTVTASTPVHAMNQADAASSTSDSQVTITPPTTALHGPGVNYPLFIDPQMGSGSQNWVEVTANGYHYYDPAADAQVGDCGSWPGCGALTVARSYFTMPTPDLDDPNIANPSAVAQVFSANFTINEQWSASGCTAEPVQLDEAGTVDGNTRWPGPDDAELGQSSSAAGSNCGSAGNIPAIDVTGYAQTAANNHWPNLTFALRAPNEGDQYQWKQFFVGSMTPELTVVYNYAPNVATGLTATTAVTCNGTNYVPDGQVTLTAAATDNNPSPENLSLFFQVSSDNYNTIAAQNANGVVIASGSTGQWPVSPDIPAGVYQSHVAVENNDPLDASHDRWAGIFDNYSFTKLAPPSAAPVISTGQYPAGYWGEPTNEPGGFGLYDSGAANIAGYSWTLAGPGSEPIPDTTQCNYSQTFTGPDGAATGGYVPNRAADNASFDVPAGLSVGYHVMYVRAFDFAHNMSPESQAYTFYVSPALSAATDNHWSEAEAAGGYSQPAGQNSTLAPQANCCGVTWSGGAQLLFEGTAQGQSFNITVNSTLTTTYELDTSLTKGPDYGIITMALDGVPIDIEGSPQFDGYSSTVTTSYNGLGGFYLTKGTHTITVTLVGTNPASLANHYVAGVDGFWLQAMDQMVNIQPVAQPNTSPTSPSPLGVQASNSPDSTGAVTPAVEQNDNGMGFPNGAQLLYPATGAGQALTLTFNTAVEADYALGLALTMKSNYGKLEFAVDQKGAGTGTILENSHNAPFDAYTPVEYNSYLPLGGLHLNPGVHTLTITVDGKNANSTGFQLGVEEMTIVAVNKITADSFTDAMNNRAITTDNGGLGADFDGWLNGWSSAAMTSAGIAPSTASAPSTFTTGGATFTMPAEGTSSSNDNVIAYGQTIPLASSQRINASAIGLLAAASCGWTPEARATVTYTDGTSTTPLMPRVPDWVGGDPASATVTTDHVDYSGGSPALARQGHLYAVFLPTDQSRTLKSITLPYTGSSQLDNTCNTGTTSTAALHIFSIAPRPASNDNPAGTHWFGVWSGATDAAVLPPGGTGLVGKTIRMIVHPTSAGGSTRIRLSNMDADRPVTISSASIAAQAGTTGTGAATLATPTGLTFGASGASVVLPVGGDVVSDPVTFPSMSGGSGNLIVSVYLAAGADKAPVHTTPANGTFVSTNTSDDTANTDGSTFGSAISGDYFLTEVDASGPQTVQNGANTGTVAILGDQTTLAGATGGNCGAGSGYACSWVDDLATTPNAGIPGTVVNASRAGDGAQDRWLLNDGSGTTAADTGGANPATASGGVTWNTGGDGSNGDVGSATFDGTDSYLATAGQVLNTHDSFTVSAWVDPKTLGTAPQTFVAQQGKVGSGFYLEYDPTTGKWSFARLAADGTNPTVDRAESSAPAVAGQWTNLVGTYSEATGAMTLYVNGSYAGTAQNETPFATTGPLVIGRGFFDGAADNYTNGSIADVQVYQRFLDPLDVIALHVSAPSGQAPLNPSAPSPYKIGSDNGADTQQLPNSPATAIYQTLGDQPNLRTIIVSIGADDIVDGVPLATIEQNLTDIVGAARAFGLENFNRSDGEHPVHVILTTIPPLGLAAADGREANREQLNKDISQFATATFKAAGFIDLNAAVVSATAANQVDSSCLTNGSLNATYYQDLANAVVAAESTFPPTTL